MAKKSYQSGTGVSSQSYTIYTGKCVYHGFRLGMDGTNPVTLTLTDGAGGTEICPTNQYDASLLGLNGEVLPGGSAITCDTGIVAVVTCSGDFELVVVYNPCL